MGERRKENKDIEKSAGITLRTHTEREDAEDGECDIFFFEVSQNESRGHSQIRGCT